LVLCGSFVVPRLNELFLRFHFTSSCWYSLWRSQYSYQQDDMSKYFYLLAPSYHISEPNPYSFIEWCLDKGCKVFFRKVFRCYLDRSSWNRKLYLSIQASKQLHTSLVSNLQLFWLFYYYCRLHRSNDSLWFPFKPI
jgi:hypothetical protein